MKGTEHFKEVIKEHLDQRAATDPLFAKTYAKENKNLDDCITYILTTVQASKRQGFTDDEVFGMAVHYYDEDNIKPGKPVQAHVVINKSIPAPSRGKTANAEPEPTQEPAPAPEPNPVKAKKPKTKVPDSQISLF